MAKKLGLAALSVVLAVVLWRSFAGRAGFGSGGHAERSASNILFASQAEPAPPARALPIELEQAALAERTAVEASEVLATGALDVRLVWEQDGRPATGIALAVHCERDPAPREEEFVAKTDGDGHARFAELFPGAVRIELDRGLRYESEVAAGEAREVTFAIPKGNDVEGRVVDPSGAVVAGAEIWVEGLYRNWPNAHLATQSGADGRLFLRGLGEDARIGARAAGFQPSLVFGVQGLPMGERDARTVTLALGEPGGGIEGRVLDPAGDPVHVALVQIGPRGRGIVDLPDGARGEQPAPVVVRTAADGSFRYPGDLAPGLQPIFATARGYPILETEVEIVQGPRVQLELRLTEPASIEGRLVDAEGNPVANVAVVCAEEVRGGWFFHAFPPPRAKTDEAGRFRLGWVAPGRRELNASDWRRERLGRARASVVCAPGELTTCELVLELGHTITGRVVDREGRPIAGWRVRGEPAMRGFIYPRQDKTDAEGRFVLANLGESTFTLTVSAPDEFPIPPRAELADVQPGTRDVQLVVEELVRKEGRVSGVLLDAAGRAPVDVDLVLYPVGGDSGGFVEFDSETGRFDHGPSAAGDYVLHALRGGRAVIESAEFTIEDGRTTDVGILRIEEPCTLELALRGVPETDLDSLRFVLDRPHHGTAELALENGHFVARKLAPGTWLLRLREAPWCVRDTEVELHAGETTSIELEAERGRELAISCSFSVDKYEWEELVLEIRDERGELVRRASPDGREFERGGRVAFRSVMLAPGTYRAELRIGPELRSKQLFTLETGAAGMRELVLE